MAKKPRYPEDDTIDIDSFVDELDFDDADEGFLVSMEDFEDDIYEMDEEDEGKILPVEAYDHEANLAEYITEAEASALINFCESRYQADVQSMDEYKTEISQGMRRLGIRDIELNEPFIGASNVTHPVVIETAVKMTEKIVGEIFNGRPIADVSISNDLPPEDMARNMRVKDHTNYQYLRQYIEFEPEIERLVLRYCLTGTSFLKSQYDPVLQRTVKKFLTEEQLVVNAKCTSLDMIDFYTEPCEYTKEEYEGLISSGVLIGTDEHGEDMILPETVKADRTEEFIDEVTMGEFAATTGEDTVTEKYYINWHYVNYQFETEVDPNEDRALPYIVGIASSTNKLVSIRRNWLQDDPLRSKLVWHAPFRFVPGVGFHGLGLIQLLGTPQKALTLMLRSLVDAGQFANLQAGLKDQRLRFLKGGEMPLGPGQFTDVEIKQSSMLDGSGTNQTLKDFIHFIDFKEPSQVLERLAMWFDGRIQKFADSTESVVGDATNYGPVGTTVALIESSAKFHNGIIKRFFRSLQKDLQINGIMNFLTMDDEVQFWFKGKKRSALKDDYTPGAVEIISAADPNYTSQAQRLQLANAKLQTAMLRPDLHDMKAIFRDFYRQLGIEDDEINKYVTPDDQAQPLSPMEDILAVSKGKPIAAFPGQDHDAHIQFKSAFLEDPQAGKHPAFGPYIPQIQANIIEHGLLKYQEQLELQTGQIADGQQGRMEAAQAIAAQNLQKLHQAAANADALESGEPTAVLANAEMKKTKLREIEIQLKAMEKQAELSLKEKEMLADYLIDIMKLDQQAEVADASQAAQLLNTAVSLITKQKQEKK